MTLATCHSCHRSDRTVAQVVTLNGGRQVALCQRCLDDSRRSRTEPIKRVELNAGQPVLCPRGHGVENIEGEGTGVLDGQHVAYARCLYCDQLIAATWHTDAGQGSLL